MIKNLYKLLNAGHNFDMLFMKIISQQAFLPLCFLLLFVACVISTCQNWLAHGANEAKVMSLILI